MPPAGIAEEVYALLTCYQALRIAITDATEAVGRTDPDRGSFTIALNVARDLLTQAANVIAGTVQSHPQHRHPCCARTLTRPARVNADFRTGTSAPGS